MIANSFPILATKRIVISKDYDEYVAETTEVSYVTEEEVTYDSPFNRRVDTVEREIVTTTPASSREFTKVKVEFLLKSRENTSLSKWFSDSYKNNAEFSEFAEFLKVYFLVLDDSSDVLAGYLQSNEFRARKYEEVARLQHLQGRQLRTAGTSISFAEILQNEKFTTTPVSDTSAYYQHDIYAEVELDISSLNLGTTSKVHLIGFMQMDIAEYTEANGLPMLPEEPYELESVGGDLIYDLLLERADSLQVPFYRKALYLNSAPYYGPAHRHSVENPGPDGYVGWMAGPPGEDMGPKLDEITVRNYKVVSSIYDYQNDESIFGLGPMSSDPAGPTGVNLESYLNSIVDRDDLLYGSRYIQELVRASSYAESKLKNNFMKSSADFPTHFISCVSSEDFDSGEITNEKSHHASVVGIDYFNLVRDMSNYGNILNFQDSKGNTDMVRRFLGGSKILDIEVIRDRVTNNAYSFNDADSLDYKIYDVNEPSKKLVNTQDDQTIRILRPGESSVSGHLIPASTELATIREINLATLNERSGIPIVSSMPGYNRFFHIKDYDLFHNIQFGKYRYSLKITLIDGIYRTINSLLASLVAAYNQATRYFNDASQPVIKDSHGLYIQGSYDYDINDFHSSFREKDYAFEINSMLVSYSQAVSFLTGTPPEEAIISQMECAIEPMSTNLDTIQHVCQTLNKLITALRNTLKANGDLSNSEDLKKQGSTHVPASGPGRKTRTIEVTIKCPDIVSALQEGVVVANYSMHQMEDEEGNDITPDLSNLSLQDWSNSVVRAGDRLFDGQLLPASYSSLSFAPYDVRQYEVQHGLIAPINTENKIRSRMYFNAAPKIMSSYSSYGSLSQAQKNNQTIMINIARSQDSVLSSYIKKPASDLVYNSFANAGVVVNMVGKALSLGVSQKDKNSTSRAKEKLKDAFEKADEENCVELSDDLKAALQNAANHGISRKEVEDTADSSYANLNHIIDVVKGTYDNMLGLIGALQIVAANVPSLPKTLTEEDKFLGQQTANDSKASDFGLQRYDLYFAESAEFFVAAPGATPVKFKPSEVMTWKKSEMQPETYLLVKAEPTKKPDAVAPVNNVHLLRI